MGAHDGMGQAYAFTTDAGRVWMRTTDAAGPPNLVDVLHANGAQASVLGCAHAPGPVPGSVQLFLVVEAGARQQVLHATVRNVGALAVTRTLHARAFTTLLSSPVPVTSVTHVGDGLLVGTADQALHYAPVQPPAARVVQLGAPAGQPDAMTEIMAAKDAIALLLNNLCTQLPLMAAAVEQAASAAVLTALGSTIKTQQQNLDKVFDQPLSALISQHGQAKAADLAAKAGNSGAEKKTAMPAGHAAVRRLLVQKLDVQRYLDAFAVRPAAARTADVLSAPADGPDTLEALGQLFASFNTLLDAAHLDTLVTMGVTDLLRAVSGTQPFSAMLDNFFNAFKIDDAMNALHGVFSGGQFAALIAKLPLAAYLQQPVQNAFFKALYAHYYPDKPFAVVDMIAFLGALLGFVAFEIQGKGDDFQAVFFDKQSCDAFTNAPATLVALMQGKPAPATAVAAAAPMMAFSALAAPPPPPVPASDPPPAWRVIVATALSATSTLILGALGAVSFGTGLIASPIVGGLAGGLSQGLFGMLKNLDTDDVQYDLLSGFVGGFSGAFTATLIGNNLFGIWAQHGDTPTDRIQRLQWIMATSALTLGAGGGAVVAALVKNYAKTGKVDFLDPLASLTGAVAGMGGGAMGCGLHFMGALSGGTCLPVALSLADAQRFARTALLGPVPVLMSNATALPGPSGLYPNAIAIPSMGVYATQFAQPGATPPGGLSIAFVKRQEFVEMDVYPNSPTAGYNTRRERLFWLEGTPPVAPNVNPVPGRIADLVIGVHGIGRYVFPVLCHLNADGESTEYTRPMYKDDFARFLLNQNPVRDLLARIEPVRRPVVKLMVCFSALPVGCCSLGQELATRLGATVYAGRPPVYPWLDAQSLPRVPDLGGWIVYNP